MVTEISRARSARSRIGELIHSISPAGREERIQGLAITLFEEASLRIPEGEITAPLTQTSYGTIDIRRPRERWGTTVAVKLGDREKKENAKVVVKKYAGQYTID